MACHASQVWRHISKYILQPGDPQRVHVLLLHAVFEKWDIQRQVSNMSPFGQCNWHFHCGGVACEHAEGSQHGSEHGLDSERITVQGPIPVWMPVPEGIQETNLAVFMESFQVREVLLKFFGLA